MISTYQKLQSFRPIYAEKAGYAHSMDTRELGLAVVSLGGGRRKPGDALDYSVGLTNVCALGDEINTEKPLAVIHAQSEAAFEDAAVAVRGAIHLSDAQPEKQVEIYKAIRAEDL